MSDINHFAISSILGSEIVGRYKFGHGQIGSAGDVQRYFDALGVTESPAALHRGEWVDPKRVAAVFRELVKVRGDRGSPDLYVADQARNLAFIAKCRELADLQASEYTLNKALFYARKKGYLKGLNSRKTSINYEDFAFASEFAATELKYKTGASIDDILCDPGLASRFDAIAGKLAPDHSSFEYRWAILSIWKAGRHANWDPDYRMPEFTGRFRLVADPLESLPDDRGLYLLYEGGKQRPLYARSTEHLRHAVEVQRSPRLVSAILDKFWKPDPASFVVSYAILPASLPLKPFEKKLVEEKRPVFNVPRVAA